MSRRRYRDDYDDDDYDDRRVVNVRSGGFGSGVGQGCGIGLGCVIFLGIVLAIGLFIIVLGLVGAAGSIPTPPPR